MILPRRVFLPAEVISTSANVPISPASPGKFTMWPLGVLPPTDPASRVDTDSTSTRSVFPTCASSTWAEMAYCRAISRWMRSLLTS